MRERIRYLGACALCALALAWSVPAALAAGGPETVTEGGFTAEISDGAAVITQWNPNLYDWSPVVPTTIGGYPVKKLGDGVFWGSRLDAVTLPEGLEEIGESTFAGSTLSSVRLPESLKVIGKQAFYACKLSGTLHIPASVESIGIYGFSYNQLSAFSVDAGNQSYCSQDGVLFDKSKTTLYNYPTARLDSSYTVPESVELLFCTSFANARNLRNLYVRSSSPSLSAMKYTFFGDRLTVWCRSGTNLYSQLEGGKLSGEELTVKQPPDPFVDCTVLADGTATVTLAGDFLDKKCFLAMYSGENKLLALRAVDSGWDTGVYSFPAQSGASEIRLFQLDQSYRPAEACETLWRR